MLTMNNYNKLGKNARKAKIISNILFDIIVILIIAVVLFVLGIFSIPPRILLLIKIILAIILLFSLINSILDVTIGYERYGYRISEKSVEIISGILFIEKKIVPIRRIQQVSLEQGPIIRKFNLATVTLITSGGNLDIEYLPLDVANEISENLKMEVNTFAEKQLLKKENYTGIIKDIT